MRGRGPTVRLSVHRRNRHCQADHGHIGIGASQRVVVVVQSGHSRSLATDSQPLNLELQDRKRPVFSACLHWMILGCDRLRERAQRTLARVLSLSVSADSISRGFVTQKHKFCADVPEISGESTYPRWGETNLSVTFPPRFPSLELAESTDYSISKVPRSCILTKRMS